MSDDGIFDKSVAATYDSIHGGSETDKVRQMVDLLSELAAGGPTLEFAIGTGRIALPLSRKGVPVKGIELSQAMIDELRKKETGPPMEIAVGDMSTVRIDGDFSLIYLVYNTIDNLTSQDEQIACFKNAAAHLKPGGRFLIETLVPPIQKIPNGETKLAYECSQDHWSIDEFDVVTQRYTSHHVRLANGSYKRLSVPFRYAWPAEFDVMAKWAGLELEHRWADWLGTPFSNLSPSHVSVWRKPDV